MPDCHFKIDVALALGKRALCNICDDEFLMTEYSIKLAKPHCGKCGKVKMTDQDGATRYVKKVTDKVLSNVALDTTNDLRNRLTGLANDTVEDDI